MTDLSGVWTLADAGGGEAVPMPVPGDVHSALVAAGRIPDPYHGRNEYAVRWVADRDWLLTRSFEDAGGPRLLVLDGLDTVAEVRLNGTAVLEAATSFREHVAAVETVAGENRIEIVLRSNTRAANEMQARAAVLRALAQPATARSRTATCCASRNATSAGTGTSPSRRSGSTAGSR